MDQGQETFSCRVCEKPVPVETGLCPYCKFQHARNFKAKITLITIFVVLAFVGIVCGSMMSSDVEIFEENGLAMPRLEKQFVDLLARYRNEGLRLDEAPDEAAKDGQYTDAIVLRAQRAEDIKALKIGPKVVDWVGKLAFFRKTQGGSLALRVDLSTTASLETWGDALEDADRNTLITPDNPLFEIVSSLADGDVVVFSGEFFPSNTDAFQETSLSIEANLQRPTFLFKFESIQKQLPK